MCLWFRISGGVEICTGCFFRCAHSSLWVGGEKFASFPNEKSDFETPRLRSQKSDYYSFFTVVGIENLSYPTGLRAAESSPHARAI
jgi:hypothetical protein